MKRFYTAFGFSFGVFMTALLLYFLSQFIQDQAKILAKKNLVSQDVIRMLNSLSAPEKYLSFLEKTSTVPLEKNLKTTAAKYYITLKNLTHLSKYQIEINLKSDLDRDIFLYLQDLLSQYPGTLSVKEFGIFRDQNHVLSKIILHRFSPVHLSGDSHE